MPHRTITALTSLAEELTARVDHLEHDNEELRKIATEQADLLSIASKRAQDVRKSVSADVVNSTVNALHKAGALASSQLDASRKILSEDPAAAHRIIHHLLDVQGQMKAASANDTDDITGGRLAGCAGASDDPQAACLDRMMSILRIF